MLPTSVQVSGLTINGPHMPACEWLNAVDQRAWSRRVYGQTVIELEVSHFIVNSGYDVLYAAVNFETGCATVNKKSEGTVMMPWSPVLNSFEGDHMHTEFVSFIAESIANGNDVPVTDGTFTVEDLIIKAIEDDDPLYKDLSNALCRQYAAYPFDEQLNVEVGQVARVLGRMAHQWAEVHWEMVATAMKEDAAVRKSWSSFENAVSS